MNKRLKSFLALTIALLLIVTVCPKSANAKSKGIDDYISASFDVYNVPIVDSFVEFKDLIDKNKITPAIEDSGTATQYTVTAKKNGCLVLYGVNNSVVYTYFSLSDVTTKTSYEIWGIYGDKSEFIPIREGDKFAIQGKGAFTFYIGFIPEEYIFQVDESKKNNNGTLSFTFGNVYGNDTVLSVLASENTYPTRQVIKEDVALVYYKSTSLYEYSSVATDNGDAVLTLPKGGEYTLTLRVKMKDSTIAVDTFVLDTNAYINPTLDKLKEPISAITGTNVIVGFGEPYTTVYVSYDGKKYSNKCDKDGIYRIVLNKELKKGVKYKIWQTDVTLTSKKTSYRVTSE